MIGQQCAALVPTFAESRYITHKICTCHRTAIAHLHGSPFSDGNGSSEIAEPADLPSVRSEVLGGEPGGEAPGESGPFAIDDREHRRVVIGALDPPALPEHALGGEAEARGGAERLRVRHAAAPFEPAVFERL